MSLDNISSFANHQTNRSEKSEQTHQHVQNQQMDKLLNSHNQIMTKILKQGLSIPKDTFEKIQRDAKALKKIFFGLDNQLFERGTLPLCKEEYTVFYTKSLPIVVPNIFFEQGVSESDILLDGVSINLLKSENWWEYQKHNINFSKFLRVGLVLFSHENHLKKENIKNIKIVPDPYIPEHAVVFSLSCNFYALVMFFHANKHFFANINVGLHAFLNFINKK
jgi:hypothetical protein